MPVGEALNPLRSARDALVGGSSPCEHHVGLGEHLDETLGGCRAALERVLAECPVQHRR